MKKIIAFVVLIGICHQIEMRGDITDNRCLVQKRDVAEGVWNMAQHRSNSKIVGYWISDWANPGHPLLYRIRKKTGSIYVMDVSSMSGNDWAEGDKMIEKYVNGFRTFFVIDREDYYIIDNKTGHLVVGDNWGYITTYEKYNK